MPVIGYLHPNLYDPASPDVTAFHQGLSETGYVEGQNLAIEYRSAAGQYDRLPALAAALVGRKVDVIVAIGGAPVMAAKSATSTIPIVFIGVGDPVASGLVASLAHPAGNLTGFSNMTIELHPKRLQLLSELVPQAMIAMLVNPNNPSAEQTIRDVQEAARARIDGGTVSPSSFAVLRLTTSSNLVGCWTGRSAGLAPLRIFPA